MLHRKSVATNPLFQTYLHIADNGDLHLTDPKSTRKLGTMKKDISNDALRSILKEHKIKTASMGSWRPAPKSLGGWVKPIIVMELV